MKAASNRYQGYEVTKHSIIMTGKMYLEIGVICLIAQAALIGILSHLFVDTLHRQLAWKYPIAVAAHYLYLKPVFNLPMQGQIMPVAGAEIAATSISEIYKSGGWAISFLASFGAWFLAPVVLRYFSKRTSNIKEDEHIRGAKLIAESEIEAQTDGTGILPIGSITISEDLSRRHILVAGQTGSGKSTLINQQIGAIQRANRRCIANDFKCEVVERYYRPDKDLILNPLDARGLGWTIFNELQSKPDLSAISGSLIPQAKGEDRFWSAAAQDVLRGVMACCFNDGKRTNAALWQALTSSISDIAKMCKSTTSGQAGYSYIQDASGKQAAGVIAVLMSYTSWLEYATDGPFSLRDWAGNASGQTIYITTREEVSNTLRPYLSLFADLAGKRFLALPDNTDSSNSIYLVLDEFGNMQKLPTVKRLLTAGRSKGVIVTIGVQELAGIESIYGREDTRTIINNCGTKMVMNLGDPEAAKFFSELAGEEEYWQASTQYSISQDDAKGGENHSRQIQVRKIILPSSIMRLPVGQGYMMLPGGNPALVEVPWAEDNKRIIKNKPFVLRDGLSLESAEALDNEIALRALDFKESPVPDELKNKVSENLIKRARVEIEADEVLEKQDHGFVASLSTIDLAFD